MRRPRRRRQRRQVAVGVALLAIVLAVRLTWPSDPPAVETVPVTVYLDTMPTCDPDDPDIENGCLLPAPIEFVETIDI